MSRGLVHSEELSHRVERNRKPVIELAYCYIGLSQVCVVDLEMEQLAHVVKDGRAMAILAMFSAVVAGLIAGFGKRSSCKRAIMSRVDCPLLSLSCSVGLTIRRASRLEESWKHVLYQRHSSVVCQLPFVA